MFLSFQHKKPQKQHIENSPHDRVANTLGQNCIQIQEHFAMYIQRRTERLSYKTKKLLVVIFFLLSTGYSLHLMVESLKSCKVAGFSITTIKFPASIGNAGDENGKTNVIVSPPKYERKHRSQLNMDSLARSP